MQFANNKKYNYIILNQSNKKRELHNYDKHVSYETE